MLLCRSHNLCRAALGRRQALSLPRRLALRCQAPAGPGDAAPSRTPLLDALSSEQQQQVESYVALLLSWNERLNLVAASQASREQILGRHVEDALALLPCIDTAVADPAAALRLTDVGSGSGFPGVVLAIARPGWSVTLVETLGKKARFLEEVCASVPLPNCRALCARAEAVGRAPDTREAADVVTARAVAELRVLAELCLPLVRPGGAWVAQKGAAPQQEVADARRAVRLLGGGEMAIHPVATLGPDGRPFTAVVTIKEARTSGAYPREAGTPKRAPL